MENKETISLWQFFILLLIFEMGSATVVGIGGEAKQNVWVAILIAGLIGVIYILLLHIMLGKKEGKNLFGLIEFCLGKWLGGAVCYLYILYFIYISSRVLRDFGELIVSTIFVYTPIEIINITIMLTIIYMLYSGIEVMARTSEIFFPYVFSFTFLVGFFILLSGEIHLENLKPFLEDGFRPILNAVFPGLLTFPFGELIAFATVLPLVTKFKKAKKFAVASIITSTLVLVYSAVIQVMTLGHEMKGRANFPLLSAAREISLLDFIERVDIAVVFVVMFGIIVKIGVFFFGAVKGLEHLSKREYRSFLFPIGSIICLSSIIITDNFAEHIEEGLKIVPYFVHLPFQFALPFLLFVIVFIRTRGKKGKKGSDMEWGG
ncbi:spore gernimation protein KC [Bacillus sp. LL01]|uniref:GerAB/ArcD/ProY family transporter n=1 Tax=Bacillus sp. LL01 TaxID=1665556 RepID=UPI00064D42D9|nr:endospore germination permease [Bacillus sp. LL01]KMJ59633.1 spore gernimation protein KC [Bacillus sp. LL01]